MKKMSHHLDTASAFALIAAFAAGLVLGAFYFTALWHTVRRLSNSAQRCALDDREFYFEDGGRDGRILSGDGAWTLGTTGGSHVRIRRNEKILTYRLGPQNATEPVQ